MLRNIILTVPRVNFQVMFIHTLLHFLTIEVLIFSFVFQINVIRNAQKRYPKVDKKMQAAAESLAARGWV